MNYFQVLGLVFGLLALLKPIYMHLLPWDEFAFLKKAYSKKRPLWIPFVACLGLLLIAFTWYKELQSEIPYSWIISILFSLTGIKALVLLLDYNRFQQWVAGLIQKDRGRGVVLVDILASAFGLLLIFLTLVFVRN